MSNLLDIASLIVTPNGYKEGKLYSVIPSDGSGDMSVIRATTATRVNSAGLVELVPYNLVQYSQEFDNAYWSKGGGATIISNSTTAPDGTLTADTLNVATSTYSGLSRVISGVSSNYNISVYAKKNTKNWLYFVDIEGGNARAWFDLDNGVLGTVASGYTATITNVGNGWYRCTLANNNLQTLGYYQLGLADANNGVTPTSSGSAYLWGAQLVEGTNALPYQKTETRLDIPRLDYSNGTCPSILVEPQRTNSCLYSNNISNSTWFKFFDYGGSAPIITDNYAISPDGSQNAQRIQLTRTTATNSYSYIFQNITGVAGQSYTWSVWLKSLSGTPSVALSNIGGSFANIVTISNEWERYEFTTAATGTGLQAMFLLYEQLTTTSLTADFLVYGFQVEAGSYATSYIPTATASVTRNADVISKTGISSLIGQTEGTIYFDGVINGCENAFANLINSERNTNTSFAIGYIKASKNIYGIIYDGSSKGFIQGGTFEIGQRIKIAYAYKSGDFALYVNGSLMGTSADTFTFPSTLDDIFIGDAVTYFAYQEAITNRATALWKTRLTNDQLEALTGQGFDTYAAMASYYNYTLQ